MEFDEDRWVESFHMLTLLLFEHCRKTLTYHTNIDQKYGANLL